MDVVGFARSWCSRLAVAPRGSAARNPLPLPAPPIDRRQAGGASPRAPASTASQVGGRGGALASAWAWRAGARLKSPPRLSPAGGAPARETRVAVLAAARESIISSEGSRERGVARVVCELGCVYVCVCVCVCVCGGMSAPPRRRGGALINERARGVGNAPPPPPLALPTPSSSSPSLFLSLSRHKQGFTRRATTTVHTRAVACFPQSCTRARPAQHTRPKTTQRPSLFIFERERAVAREREKEEEQAQSPPAGSEQTHTRRDAPHAQLGESLLDRGSARRLVGGPRGGRERERARAAPLLSTTTPLSNHRPSKQILRKRQAEEQQQQQRGARKPKNRDRRVSFAPQEELTMTHEFEAVSLFARCGRVPARRRRRRPGERERESCRR
jgi:hypothetical protein